MKLDRRGFIASTALGLAAMSREGESAQSSEDPLGVREDFPAATSSTYLNAPYIAPVPKSVEEAGVAFVRAKTRSPISLGDMLAKRDEVRNQFASLFGADAHEVGFLYSTSEGENIVSHALHLKPGDNVVIDDLHYTTTYVLYDTLAKKLGFEIRVVPSVEGRADPEHFEPYVNDRTRLVSVSWVSHQNGFRHDLKGLAALAHAHGAYLYADAIQALGMFPANLRDEGVDFATSGTYKWLLGTFGVAPFFVREEHLDLIAADRLGFLALKEEAPGKDFVFYDDARKYEYSTLAFGPIYQLGASLEYLKGVGLDRIERHTVALAHRMRDALAERGYKVRTPTGNGSSIVAFWHGKDPKAAQTIFEVANVKVSFREGGVQIRAGAALFNNESDIDRFLEVVDRLV